MKNKIFIIVFIIIFIILAICLLIFIKDTSNDNYSLEEQQNDNVWYRNHPTALLIGKKPEILEVEGMRASVELNISNFAKSISEKNTPFLLGILDKKYIEKRQISKSNILEILKEFNQLKVKQIYHLTSSNNVILYIVCTNNNEDLYLRMNLDVEKNTYAILPMNAEEFNEVLNYVIEEEFEEFEIEKNESNEFIISQQ